MRTYSLSKKSNESIYEFLYECIKKDIISGNLKPGEKLPSKRAFSTNQGVSIVTVENTYAQLQAEGYIFSKPKSGFYVADIEYLSDTAPVSDSVAYDKYIPDSQNNDLSYEQSSTDINLISNHTLSLYFPFQIWAKITRTILSMQEPGLLSSPPTGGVNKLRESISKHLMDFRGISVNPQQIIIGAGTEYLYGLIVQLLGRNLTYGLENPCSPKIRNIYKALGVNITDLIMDKEGICISSNDLENTNIVHISPSHQYPTGIVTSARRRYELLQWVVENENRYIIEDDYDSEFRLLGRPIPSLFSMDSTNKVIYFNTFSKSLSSTIRISYMVLPMPLLELFKEKLGFYSCTVSNFDQYILATFINDGYFEKHINRMRNTYKKLRDKLISSIQSSTISDKISIREENAGLHFIMSIKTDLSEEILKKRLLSLGIRVAFLSEYLSTSSMDAKAKPYEYDYSHKLIINYSGIRETDIPLIVDAFSKALIDRS